MDLQPFLTMSAAALAFALLAQAIIHRTYRNPGAATLLPVHGLTILVAVAGFYLFPDYAGYASAAMLSLAIAPPLALSRAEREAASLRLESAAFYARLAMFLHPSSFFRFASARLSALAEPTSQGRLQALAALEADAPPDQKPLANLQLLSERRDWDGILRHLQRGNQPAWTAGFAIRALGETGRLDDMIAIYRQIADLPRQAGSVIVELQVLAFCGRVEAVRKLEGHMMPVYRRIWEAVACQAAGRHEEAVSILSTLAAGDLDDREREIVAARLAEPAAEAAPLLGPYAAATVSTLEAGIATRPRRRSPLRTGPMTLALVAANCLMFAVEVATGGSQDIDALMRLGAVWPDAVVSDHEYWRMLAALFLHAGPEHLAGNMFALWFIGMAVEQLAGSLRMALIYFLGGLASMGGVVWCSAMGWIEPNVLVGASGAIFALIGAISLRRVHEYRATRSLTARRNLILLILVIALQASLDLLVPQISFTAHAIGFAAGLALGFALLPRMRW